MSGTHLKGTLRGHEGWVLKGTTEEMSFIYPLLLFSCFSSFSMVIFLPSMN